MWYNSFSLSLRDDDDEVGTESERYVTGEVSAGAMRVNSFLISKIAKKLQNFFVAPQVTQTTRKKKKKKKERKEEQPPTTPGEREREKRKHTFPPTNTTSTNDDVNNKQRHEL